MNTLIDHSMHQY